MSEQQNQNLVETYQDGKVVFDGKIIRLEHWTVKLPNGNLALREVACHPGASAVVALDDDNNIILVQQYRAPIGRLTLEIPAGKFDHVGEVRCCGEVLGHRMVYGKFHSAMNTRKCGNEYDLGFIIAIL